MIEEDLVECVIGLGPNLFYNSVVSLNLENGNYKWHFQEIEHDVLNLDLASSD